MFRSAPAGHRSVATGEAKRNPWERVVFPSGTPKGCRNRSLCVGLAARSAVALLRPVGAG
jgi:hypothetical protein